MEEEEKEEEEEGNEEEENIRMKGRNEKREGGRGRIGRAERMAKLVFSDPEKLKKLNSLVHPVVALRFQEWLSAQTHPYVIKEAAILF